MAESPLERSSTLPDSAESAERVCTIDANHRRQKAPLRSAFWRPSEFALLDDFYS